ncbi:zinc-dependent alcohol dehydrogenase [Demequina lutea]|uniref:L-iditol 2-dehydrogenase n=1 Tax=Demequina lutea TaxID=431489 RepID=A0A7Z0CL08_9MICO|nr:alcohol dehydrogenase catalytic domain-containing protein [Demequina lutea]NYI42392.1 L-iditol 2-dehydrogenase [Demequina lutea]
MRAARLHSKGNIQVHDEARPELADGMSLVRVTDVGLCGSDLHWFAEGGIGDAQIGQRPLVLGHEIAGVVEAGPLKGAQVAVDPAIPCGHCTLCLQGHRNLCPTVRFAGHGENDGGLREYMTWPTELLHPLPSSITTTEGAVLEPLGVALHALDLSGLRTGSTVAVIGCGPIGLLLVQLALVAGAARVVAVDPLEHRRHAALGYGADLALAPEDLPDHQAVVDAVGPLGVDVAFEVAGVNDAVEQAIAVTMPGGRVVLVGIPEDDRTSFCASAARRKGLTIMMVRRMKEDVYPRGIRLVEQGRVDALSIVTRRFPLDQVEDAFVHASSRSGLKVIVQP